MAMQHDLVMRLQLAAEVGALAGDRVSWAGFQRGDGLPGIALYMISPGREWTHSGPDGLDRPRVQVDCRAATIEAAFELARAVRDELETAADVGGTRFHPAMLDGEGFIDEGEQDGGDPLFRVSQDFLFHHEEI